MLPLTGWTDLNTGAALDPDFIKGMINRTLGEAPQIRARMRVVDYGLQPVAMNIPGSSDTSDLARLIDPKSATLESDSTQLVHRKLSFTMKDPLELGQTLLLDPYNHLLRPSVIYSCQGKTVEFPLGTYVVQEPRDTIHAGRRVFQINAQDLTSLLSIEMLSDWTITIARYNAAGGGYIQSILDLMTGDSVPIPTGLGQTPQGNPDCGPGIPLSMIDVDWSGNQAVAIAVPLRAGSNRGQNIADLCSAANYWGVHIGLLDDFRLKRIPDFKTNVPSATWDYSPQGKSIAQDGD
jgi:hypothetical protein